MEEVSATVINITENIESIRKDITVMADKTGEGLERVDSIRQKAEGMKADATASQVSAADMVARISGELSTAIEQSKQVEEINKLTDEILSISSQTNLLALNASIEAKQEPGKPEKALRSLQMRFGSLRMKAEIQLMEFRISVRW